MNYQIRSTPLLLQKLAFLQKYSEKVQIEPTTLSTQTMQIRIPRFCDFTIGVIISDFIEVVKHADTITILKDKLTYSYSIDISGTMVAISKAIDVFDLNYNIVLSDSIASLRLSPFRMLSKNDHSLVYRNNILTVTSDGFIKTVQMIQAEAIDASEEFSHRIRAKSLHALCNLVGECIMNVYENAIVIYSLEAESETALFASVLC